MVISHWSLVISMLPERIRRYRDAVAANDMFAEEQPATDIVEAATVNCHAEPGHFPARPRKRRRFLTAFFS